MDNLDRIIHSTREMEPEPAELAAAGERVRAKLFGAGSDGIARITGCADFKALLPSYLAKTISDARRMLIDDHMRECTDCRRHLEDLRGTRSKVRPFVAPAATAQRPSTMRWAIAAAMTLTVGGTAWWAYRTGPGSTEPLVAVQSLNGSLYHLTSTGSLPAGEGEQFLAGEEVRTPIGSRAVLRLFDGSLIEMNERSELSVVRGWRSTRIKLERGNIIVQAAKQKTGTLQVASGEALVTVRGTIFSVNRGTKGTRVSVVEGAVEVAQAGRNESLKPGGQSTTDASLGNVPVKEEIAWSRDSARYLALLGELSTLEQKLEAVPGPALRHSSKLLPLIPDDTRVFIAVPNLGGSLGEFKRLFEDQLRESPMLKEWWEGAANANSRKDLDAAIAKIQTLAGFLGEEVVVSLNLQGHDVVALAEIKREGIGDFLSKELPEARLTEGREYRLHKGFLVMSSSPQRLAAAVSAIDQGGAVANPFRARIQQAYQNGAAWLLCADMEQIFNVSVNSAKSASPMNLGLDNMRYLVLERRDVAGRTNNSATLTFTGERKGIASWLASPSSLKTLEYVSPEAALAASAVTKNPRLVLEDVIRMIGGQGDNAQRSLADFEQKVGVSVMNDLAASIGSEITFALDGPVLPTPAWKLAIEVLAPQKLQWSIERMIEAANRELASTTRKIAISSETANGRLYYKVTSQMPFEIHYSYADGYLLAGSSRGQVISSLDSRRNGVNLARSEKFRNGLPFGSNPNFSAVLYHDLGGALGPVAEQLKATGYGSPEFQKGLDSVKSMKVSVVGIQGEPDRITASSTGSMFGLNLSMIASLQQGKFPIFSIPKGPQ